MFVLRKPPEEPDTTKGSEFAVDIAKLVVPCVNLKPLRGEQSTKEERG
jgi:hypothetical protein